MSREIRRVTEDWKHPYDEQGRYKPLYDRTYLDALETYAKELEKYITQVREGDKMLDAVGLPYTFDEWWGSSPNPKYYRPAWDGEPECYQIYETVSEGTPVSPVFADEDQMLKWLLGQGHSEDAARKFTEVGSAFSMSIRDGEIKSNIDTLDHLTKKKEE